MKRKTLSRISAFLCVLIFACLFAADYFDKVWLGAVTMGLVFLALGFLLLFNRCPWCGKYLRRTGGGKFCPHCGSSLEDD